MEAFQAFSADGPTHDLTAELLPAAGEGRLPAGALALPNREETPDPRRPKEPDEARVGALLDMTPWGRQQDFEDSPAGWPQKPTYG